MNGTTGAIFIPCRGGGTATTYYTDEHNVDEDLRTISNYGDAWAMGNWAGVTRRTMNDSPTTTLDDVASRQKINRTYSPSGDACQKLHVEIG